MLKMFRIPRWLGIQLPFWLSRWMQFIRISAYVNVFCWNSIAILFFSCGHQESVRCVDSRDGKISECKSKVVQPNPICGHDLEILCHQIQDVREFEPWPEDKNYSDFVVNVNKSILSRCYNWLFSIYCYLPTSTRFHSAKFLLKNSNN